MVQSLFIWFYVIPAFVMMAFAVNLYVMMWLFERRRMAAMAEVAALPALGETPLVVTQIPIYNEYNVIERCLRAAVAMDWPDHVVQVLDDSTDETSALVDALAAELNAAGCRVEVVRREERIGFKAGALEEGMRARPDAAYFAIFDADFVPPSDFLRRTMRVMLAKPRVGIVQARWGHLNRGDSLLTAAQGLGIDGHFAVEQPARAWNGLFMNFNGTAGLWHRAAIEAAGGWEHDTLTEDMDLSYRSQLAGWVPFFLWDLEAPAEVPADINAFKSQQFRWAKGSIETAIKLLPRVWRSDAGWFAKLQAVGHMCHYLVHPIMLWMAVLFYPLLALSDLHRHPVPLAILVVLVLVSTLAPTILYSFSRWRLRKLNPGREGDTLWALPVLSLLGIGIAVSNTRAVWQAIRGKRTAFVRTPKRGQRETVAYRVRMPVMPVLEIGLGLYCLGVMVLFWSRDFAFAMPFIALYAAGFLTVGTLSLLHGRPLRGRVGGTRSNRSRLVARLGEPLIEVDES